MRLGSTYVIRCNKYLSLVKNDDVMDLIVVFCILFVFMLVLYRFCVATEFSVNKDSYLRNHDFFGIGGRKAGGGTSDSQPATSVRGVYENKSIDAAVAARRNGHRGCVASSVGMTTRHLPRARTHTHTHTH